MVRRAFRVALGSAALVILGGCTSWSRPAPVAPELFERSRVWESRVTTRLGNDTLLLANPAMTTDSIVGTDGRGTRVAVALHDVQHVSVRRSDVLRTTALVGGGVAAAALMFLLLFSLNPAAT